MRRENSMKVLKYIFNNFEYLLGGFCSVVMVTLIFVQVVFRYAFNSAPAFTEELAVILFIFTVYLGAIGATRRNQHLRVDLFLGAVKRKSRLIMEIIADVAFIIANAFIIYGVIVIAMNLKHYGMETAILHIPKWTCYIMLPFAFTIISLRLCQNIAYKIEEIKSLKNEGGI